jgi:hypothetical protein
LLARERNADKVVAAEPHVGEIRVDVAALRDAFAETEFQAEVRLALPVVAFPQHFVTTEHGDRDGRRECARRLQQP